MRKLQQIEQMQYGEVLALDENGELWFGKLETTDDERRAIKWTPVNTPPDGAAYTEPQLSRFDKFEKEAHERLRIDAVGEAVSVETEEETDAGSTGGEAASTSGERVKDGDGSDPGHD